MSKPTYQPLPQLVIRRITETKTYLQIGHKPKSINREYWERDMGGIHNYPAADPVTTVIEDWRDATEAETIIFTRMSS